MDNAQIDLLTKAVGDITAALIMAGKQDKIAEWTAPYVAAINEADSETEKFTASDYKPAQIEFLQQLLDRYSEGGGLIDLADDHPAFMRIVMRNVQRLAEIGHG